MACNSEHLRQTNKEIELQKAAQLYLFVRDCLGIPVPPELEQAANTLYCTDDYTESLCSTLQGFNEEQMQRIVYDGRNKQSRELADWWEAHLQADQKRLQSEEALTLAERLKLKEQKSRVQTMLEQAQQERQINEQLNQALAAIDRFFESKLPRDLEKLYDSGTFKDEDTGRTYLYKTRDGRTIEIHLQDCAKLGFGKSFYHGVEHRDFGAVPNVNTETLSGLKPGILRGDKLTNMTWEYFWIQLSKFCKKSGFSNVQLSFGHDGVGMESWPAICLHF